MLLRVMSIKERIRRMRMTGAELHAESLKTFFASLDATPIADMVDREVVRIAGQVKRMRTAPRFGVMAVEYVITDGTGEATVVFTGRSSVAGMPHGARVVVEGAAHPEKRRHVLLNPSYTLLPH